MSLAAKLPYDHPYAGGYPGIGSQPIPSDGDALTYLAAVADADGAGVEVGVANAVDAFVRGCKADGVWDAIKASCILAGARTLAGALVPLKGDAPTNVADGFVSGDYTRGGATPGLRDPGATSYLDSGRASNADLQNDVHISRYASAVGTQSPFEIHIGCRASSPNYATTQIGYSSGGGFYFLAARNESDRVDVVGARLPGFAGAKRSVSSEMAARIGGVDYTEASVSQSPPALPYYVFARNNNGTADGFTDARLAFYSIGSAISDLAALDTHVSNLVANIGAAI